ncbi:MAG: helix-hairpin-helix domain-containing protein [Thermoplasmata archaeon]
MPGRKESPEPPPAPGIDPATLVEALREIADLLDLAGERFKPEAYRRAARSLEPIGPEIWARAREGRLAELPGIGSAIEAKIREYLATGRIADLDRLRASTPEGVRELMVLPGIGPRTARRFWVDFGIEGPAELEAALGQDRFRGAAGFGPIRIAALRSALAVGRAGAAGGRRPLEEVVPRAEALRRWLAEEAAVDRVVVAGSYRRGRENVGDLDLLVTARDPAPALERFARFPDLAAVVLRGSTKATIRLRDGLQVDLRVVDPDAFGAAEQYFTGSKDHNIRLRSRARALGLKINEYGVFRGEERIAGTTEEEVYRAVGLPWIPPELREDRGEIEAAESGRLPRLVEAADLRGDLHLHLPPAATPESVDALRRSARALRLEYLGIVVRAPGPDGTVEELPPALLEAIDRRSEGVTIHPLEEVARPDAAEGGVELRPLDPDGAAPIARVHLRSPPAFRSGARPRDRPIAFEVGPSADRLDPPAARRAIGSGWRLLVPTGIEEGTDRPTGTVALRYARRAWATAAQVVNAAPGPDGGLGAGRPATRRPSARAPAGPAPPRPARRR